MNRTRKPLFPIRGYVILNVVVLATLTAIYFASHAYAKSNHFSSVGLFPVLLVCYLSFLVVSVFDLLFDRYTLSQWKRNRAESQRSSASRETLKKTD